jgi:hypothetical protein
MREREKIIEKENRQTDRQIIDRKKIALYKKCMRYKKYIHSDLAKI